MVKTRPAGAAPGGLGCRVCRPPNWSPGALLCAARKAALRLGQFVARAGPMAWAKLGKRCGALPRQGAKRGDNGEKLTACVSAPACTAAAQLSERA